MSTFVYKKSGPNPYRIKFDDPDCNTDCCVANPENGPKGDEKHNRGTIYWWQLGLMLWLTIFDTLFYESFRPI